MIRPPKHLFPFLMEDCCWTLLGMYVAVINFRLLGRKWPMLNVGRVVGAILSKFLLEHQEWIREEFKKVQLEALRTDIPRFYDSDQLAAISSASSTNFPFVLRIGKDRRNPARRAINSAYKLVRGTPSLRSLRTVYRPDRPPQEVRGGGGPSTSGADTRIEEDGGSPTS